MKEALCIMIDLLLLKVHRAYFSYIQDDNKFNTILKLYKKTFDWHWKSMHRLVGTENAVVCKGDNVLTLFRHYRVGNVTLSKYVTRLVHGQAYCILTWQPLSWELPLSVPLSWELPLSVPRRWELPLSVHRRHTEQLCWCEHWDHLPVSRDGVSYPV